MRNKGQWPKGTTMRCGVKLKPKKRKKRKEKRTRIMAPCRPIPRKMRDNPTHRSRASNIGEPQPIGQRLLDDRSSNLYNYRALLLLGRHDESTTTIGRDGPAVALQACLSSPRQEATTCGGRNGIICLWAGIIK